MLKIKYAFAFTLLIVSTCTLVLAQSATNESETSKATTYLLPDGKIFEITKWDSLEHAWGKGSIMFRHSEEDDKKGIIHLVRITDEMKRKTDQQKSQMESSFAAMINRAAPDFELTDLQGRHWSLKDLRGKVVVLNFWFTSCAPCIQELPELNTLVYMYGSGTVVFLALTFNDTVKVNNFLKKRKFNYVLLPNSQQVDEVYHISTWPTSMVIDKSGNIKKIILSSPKIREELASAIEEAKQVK